MIEEPILEQCYLCKKWWLEGDMKHANVPDQSGHVKKPVCVSCLEEIEDRSKSITKSTRREASESPGIMVPKKQKMVQPTIDKNGRRQFREVRMIPIDMLVEAEWNPQKMNDKEFNALVENLKQVGVIDPLQVVPLSDRRYRVIGGNHRVQALRVLEYEQVHCVICDDFDEDMQKFQSARLNMIHGKLNAERFIKLHEEMMKKYGKEALDMFMVTDEKVLKSMIKDIKAGLSPEMAKKVDEAKKEIKSVDDIGSILNEIFSKHGQMLERGFLIFSFGGKEHHYVEMDKQLLKRVKYLEELAMARQESVSNIFNRVLSEKGVL